MIDKNNRPCAIVDISIAVVDLLQETTDLDTLTENEEGADILLDALVRITLV